MRHDGIRSHGYRLKVMELSDRLQRLLAFFQSNTHRHKACRIMTEYDRLGWRNVVTYLKSKMQSASTRPWNLEWIARRLSPWLGFRASLACGPWAGCVYRRTCCTPCTRGVCSTHALACGLYGLSWWRSSFGRSHIRMAFPQCGFLCGGSYWTGTWTFFRMEQVGLIKKLQSAGLHLP